MAILVNQNNKDASRQPGATSNIGQTVQPGAATGAPAYVGNASQTKPASSGRFVNTQAFLNANKNAGQQIGGAIQSGINRQLDQEKTATNKEAENVRSGIASAQGNVQQGGQYLGQIGGDASKFGVTQPVQKLDTEGMVNLANDADKFKQFTDYRTGATAQADTTNLNNLNQTYADRASAANAALAARQQQLSNEANRFGLLGEFVGQKNNYGQGAQRLDQVFLQRDKSGALNNLNQNLAAQKSGDFANLLTQGNTLKDQAGNVITQAGDLSKALGEQTGTNETGYLNNLNSQVAGVNAQRDAQRQQYKDFLDIMKGQKQGSVADPVWSDFGLADNMNVYNTFGNINDIGEIANISAQQAKDYHDIATQKNVDQYDALARLAGMNNAKLNQAGNLEAAAKAKQASDPNSLLNRIINSYNSMLDTANATNLTGTGVESYDAGWGRSGEARDYTTANLGNVLRGAGIDTNVKQANLVDNLRQDLTPGQIAKNYTSDAMADVKGVINGDISGSSPLANPILNPTGWAMNAGFNDLSRVAGGLFGAGSGNAQGAAKTKSVEDLQRQIAAWQQAQGLQNVATRTGVKDRNDTTNFVNTMKMMNGGAV